MTLDEATAKFESRFESVYEFDPDVADASCTPDGQRYRIFITGVEKEEGADLPPHTTDARQGVLVQLFIQRMMELDFRGATKLYWRVRPLLETDPENPLRKCIYCRLAVGF